MTKIFFDHFPKTAGTSVYVFFAEAFGKDAISPHLMGMELASALSLYRQKKAIVGHFFLHPNVHLPKEYVLATVLRNPRERTLSEYFFLNSVPYDDGDHIGKLIRQSSLEDVFNKPDMCKRFLNPQAIHYAGFLHPAPATLSESELLKIGKESLDLFHLVGTTELLSELIEKIRSLFPLNIKASLKLRNVTFNRGKFADLPPNIQARIDELTRIDRLLWEYAGDLFRSKTQTITIDDLPGSIDDEHLDSHVGGVNSNDESGYFHGNSVDLCPVSTISNNNTPSTYGDGSIRNVNITVQGQLATGRFLMAGELATLRIQFHAMQDIDDLTVGYAIQHESGLHLFGINSRIYGYQLECKAGGEYYVDFVFPVMLGLGKYSINLKMHPGHTHVDRCYFKEDQCATFEVGGFLGPFFEGIIRLMPAMTFGAADNRGGIKANDVRAREDVFRRLGMNTEIFDATGSLVALAEVGSVGRGEPFALGVEINSCSNQIWYGQGKRPVQLSYHWLDENGEMVEYDGHRSPLPGGAIRPGQTVRADAMVEAPDRIGRHVLVISLVQESVCWFEDRGFQPARISVDILAS